MYKFFGKLFVKDYKELERDDVRSAYGKMAGTVGIISNLMLGVLKVILGIITLSISIIADAINNVTDCISSLVTIFGYKISEKEADEDHPFGHQRVEFISGLIVALLMLVVGVLFLKESITKIISPEEMHIDVLTIVLLGVSILVKFLQSLFYKSISKAIDSVTLKANAQDSLNDSISTFFVIVGLVIYSFTSWVYIDGIIGACLAIYVIITSIGLIKEASDPLIGTIPSVEELNNYKHIIKSYEGILGVHDMIVHSYGPSKLFMVAHAEVSSKVSILKSHEIIDDIERDFRNKYNIDLTIHMDPIEDEDDYTNSIRFALRDKVKALDERMDIHDFRLVKGEGHTNILFDCEMPIDYPMKKSELRETLIKLVKEIDPKFNAVIQIDKMFDRHEN